MPGWDSAAVVRASARNRSRNLGSLVSSLLSTFTATVRCSTLSSACHTSPIPPTAIRRESRYRSPSRVSWASVAISPALADVEHGLHHGLRDRPGSEATGHLAARRPGVLEHDGDRDLRIVRRGEADEPGVRLLPGCVLGGT